jgi:hypothetical protein
MNTYIYIYKYRYIHVCICIHICINIYTGIYIFICIYININILGEFMPNRQILDPNSNGRLNILRCKINNSKQAYLDLARNEDKMIIEIYREVYIFMYV